jgi:pyruvate formate lyase activating enzyme
VTTAMVFNVQRFSVHDGPGIRTTVFLKGCPLRCPWCHNPESMDARPQVAIKADRCLGCNLCAPACPENLAGRVDLSASANRPDETCIRCGSCADACPVEARDLLGGEIAVNDLMAEIERDRPYFEESGGGVTFSGGEPVAAHHAPFLLACLKECGRTGIHRAVDTCGFVPTETLLEVAANADLLLFDLKIMDPALHRATVGVDNAAILDNLRRVTAAGHEVIVRVPLVPGLTDDEANLEAIGQFVAGLDKPCPVELLPYHGTGGDKYGRLGMEYSLAGLKDLGPDEIAAAAAPLRARGLTVISGG